MIPANATVANAASVSVSLSFLGRKGTVSIGSKTKSGTWWQMKHQYGAEVYEAYQKSKGAENLVGQAESCIASYSEKTR